MTKVRFLAALTMAGIVSAAPAAAQSVDECRARAQWAEEETSGAMAGATKGALGGAALGAIVGDSSKSAKRGAALGALAGGISKRNTKREAYDREFTSCMREAEARQRQD